jgi:hypothetical protein
VGALVRVTTAGVTRMRAVGAQSSYLSQEPPGEVFFGLGRARSIDRLAVTWPDGSQQTFAGLPTRSTIRLREGGRPEVSMSGR